MKLTIGPSKNYGGIESKGVISQKIKKSTNMFMRNCEELRKHLYMYGEMEWEGLTIIGLSRR